MDHSARASLLDQALGYLARRLPVFPVCGVLAHTHLDDDGQPTPCTSPGKVPLVRWRAYQDRLPIESEVRAGWRRWPDANIGMTTGHLSGIVVLDLDGQAAIHAAQALGYDNGPHAFTGRVGGQHRYFAWRDDAPRNFAKRNGIDYRGEGGYVVLPPSRHASGRGYVWGEEIGDLDDLPQLPEWVGTMAAQVSPIGTGQRARQRLEVPDRIGEHMRNDTLARLAGVMRRPGFSQEAIVAALLVTNRERCDPPLDDAEVRTIAVSVARYSPAPVRLYVSGVES